MLRQVAESVQRYLENQKGDPQVFRYGGEEFAILASGLTRDESQALAQGVCNAVRAIDWEGERRSDYKLNEAGLDYIRNQRDHGAMTVSVAPVMPNSQILTIFRRLKSLKCLPKRLIVACTSPRKAVEIAPACKRRL